MSKCRISTKNHTREMEIFVQTPFSHSTSKLEHQLELKIRAKKFTPQNDSLFSSTSCFGLTKITTSI